jgi:hypothetical protein
MNTSSDHTGHERPSSSTPVARWALLTSTGLLAAGLAASVIDSAAGTRFAWFLVDAGLALLIAVPIMNVAAVSVVEWQRRAWTFACSALAVLMLVALNLFWPT